MAGLTLPHIVGFIESGTAEPLIDLVMELIPGPDAAKALEANGPLTPATAVRVACQMLAGLAHAHEKGIVHREIMPSNLLIGGAKGKRSVKVADFGLARMFEECRLTGLTFQGEIGGTPLLWPRSRSRTSAM